MIRRSSRLWSSLVVVGLLLPVSAFSENPVKEDVSPSSIRWKENVKPIRDALARTCRLNGVTFDWKPQYGGLHDIGFIAEDVGRVVPEVVEWETPGKDAIGLKYEKLTPLLTEAIKEMRSEQQRQSGVLDTHAQTLNSHAEQISSNTETLEDHEDRLAGLVNMVEELTSQVEELRTENLARIAEIDELRTKLEEVQQTCAQAATTAAAAQSAPAKP